MSKAVAKTGPKAPWKFTPEVIGKLQAAFANGFNIKEACYYANINVDTYYEWLKRDAKFTEDMSKAQNSVNMQSKKVISSKITHGSDENARWWLSRRDPDFQPKPNTQVNILNQNMIKEVMEDEALDGWSI